MSNIPSELNAPAPSETSNTVAVSSFNRKESTQSLDSSNSGGGGGGIGPIVPGRRKERVRKDPTLLWKSLGEGGGGGGDAAVNGNGVDLLPTVLKENEKTMNGKGPGNNLNEEISKTRMVVEQESISSLEMAHLRLMIGGNVGEDNVTASLRLQERANSTPSSSIPISPQEIFNSTSDPALDGRGAYEPSGGGSGSTGGKETISDYSSSSSTILSYNNSPAPTNLISFDGSISKREREASTQSQVEKIVGLRKKKPSLKTEAALLSSSSLRSGKKSSGPTSPLQRFFDLKEVSIDISSADPSTSPSSSDEH